MDKSLALHRLGDQCQAIVYSKKLRDKTWVAVKYDINMHKFIYNFII